MRTKYFHCAHLRKQKNIFTNRRYCFEPSVAVYCLQWPCPDTAWVENVLIHVLELMYIHCLPQWSMNELPNVTSKMRTVVALRQANMCHLGDRQSYFSGIKWFRYRTPWRCKHENTDSTTAADLIHSVSRTCLIVVLVKLLRFLCRLHMKVAHI